MKIELPICGIVLEVENDAGTITSDLHEDDDIEEICERTITQDEEDLDKIRYDAAMDAIESIILAHACAGVNVTTPAYLQGIETAIQACVNNY